MRLSHLITRPAKAINLRALARWRGTLPVLVRHRSAPWVGLAAIFAVAVLFRFTGMNWDDGHHLHPDERFLSSVTNGIRWPDTFSTYFDPTASPLSPYALPDMGLYVYGTLPVYLIKWVAIALDRNNYDQITLIGRVFSAVFDLAAIMLLFLIARRLYDDTIALLGAALLSITVLNIQLAHFYAVDTFATLFVVATIYFVVRASTSGSWWHYAFAGLALGMGMASKLSVLTLAVPILCGVGLDFYRRLRAPDDVGRALEQTLVRLITLVAVAALTFRLLQPIAFQGPEFWNWSLNPRWLRDIDEQRKMLAGEADFPPVLQWTGTPAILFPLQHMIQWGMGLPLGLAAWAGWGLAVFELVRRRQLAHLLPVAFIGATFLYHGMLFVKFMRYFLPIYPFLVLMAAYLMVWIWRRAVVTSAPTAEGTAKLRALLRSRSAAAALGSAVVVGTLLYAVAFASIYTRTHSRVAASRWLYNTLPPGSVLATEHWDDALPIGGLDGKTAYGEEGLFSLVKMPLYEDDTPEKLDRVIENLSNADYIVVSSNRLYGSIPRLPIRYPMTIRYYDLLFGGRLGFTKIAEFSSYPQLFGITIADQGAEESFSVYDHPRVQIFKKDADFDVDTMRASLSDGIDWDAVLHVSPRAAGAAPRGLMLTPADRQIYSQAAASIGESTGGWGHRLPVLAWILALLMLGLIAQPLTMLAFRCLADRGYILAKMTGLLIVGWVVWLAASARMATFTWWPVIGVTLLLAVVSGLLARRRMAELRAFIYAHWWMLLLQEGLFWAFFFFGLLIRWRNPDLWHPGMGGEKPMDLAYLTAIVRTPYFPAYDPWFAGGYINYYYFGFVLVGVMVHLTGIQPHIAYNLAVPTLIAMTALGAFTATYNLTDGWQRGRSAAHPAATPRLRAALGHPITAGLLGALFVAVIGNLGELQVIVNGLRNLSSIQDSGGLPFLLPFTQIADGLIQYVFNHGALNLPTEWWYWNATRVIPAVADEAGPINEFPFFTFLFADLHAHMMALPYTLLALAFGVNIIREPYGSVARAATGKATAALPWWHDRGEVLTLGLLALTLGALWPLNTWDFPTYAALTAAALVIREYARRGRLDYAGLWGATWQWCLVIGAGWLFFLPFHRNYASAYFGIQQWHGSRTPVWAYLIIHGFFLFVLSSYLLVELLHGRGHNGVIRALALTLKRPRRATRAVHLQRRLVHPAPWLRLGWTLTRFGALAVLALLIMNFVFGLTSGLILLTMLLLLSARPDPRRQFVLCMIGLGLVLTLAVELLVIKGDISRMNTVFKFYLQAWVLWAVAAAAVLPPLARLICPRYTLRYRAGEAAAPITRRDPIGVWGARVWWYTFALLLGACLLYPICATSVRARDRFPQSTQSTLDGIAYMTTSIYNYKGQDIQLEWDRQAITWLKNNVHGLPEIVEASARLYTWGSRVATNTGLPTVIGWDWHQKQQRSVMPGGVVDRRIEDVNTIYTSTDIEEVRRLLGRYHVRYIYVGALERIVYAGDGLTKFAQYQGQLWDLVYQNEQVQIYQLR